MKGNFYGEGVEESYEKSLKDFNVLDWCVLIFFGFLILGAIVSGFLGHIGIMVALVGVCFCMIDVMIRVIFRAKNSIALVFVVIGILAIVGGVFVEFRLWNQLQYYVIFVYTFIAFGVAIICLKIRKKDVRKLKTCSLKVEAICEIVDVKRIGIYDVGDTTLDPRTMVKPAFHYVIDGKEYFTESTVYYGDLNEGFKEGAKVLLQVNPDNPHEILPTNADASIRGMLLAMGIGWIIGGLVGIVLFVLMLKGVISFH